VASVGIAGAWSSDEHGGTHDSQPAGGHIRPARRRGRGRRSGCHGRQRPIGFQRRITREIDALLAKADAVLERGLVTEADLEGLPEPVQRWLRWSRVVGTPRPVTVRLKQDGQFRLGEDRGWLPFAAEQYFTSDPPAFLWWVRMQMVPLVSVAGRDRYVDGQGDMDLRLLSLVPVARKRGGGPNQGDLLRFLTEALCWFQPGRSAATSVGRQSTPPPPGRR